MAEHPWPDGGDLERAPEEAAIETWLEESSVYLKIPRPCEAAGRRCDGRRDVGAKAGTSVRVDFSCRGWISTHAG